MVNVTQLTVVLVKSLFANGLFIPLVSPYSQNRLKFCFISDTLFGASILLLITQFNNNDSGDKIVQLSEQQP